MDRFFAIIFKSLSLLTLVILSLFAGINLNESGENESILQFSCTITDCFFPSRIPTSENITIMKQIVWKRDENLILLTTGNIIFTKGGKITIESDGSLFLKSGINPGDQNVYLSSVKFEGDYPQIELKGKGRVYIYYNPLELEGEYDHKYYHPQSFDYFVKPRDSLFSFMLVNDIYDLQGMNRFPSRNYALSQDIDATITKTWWENKQGFTPIGEEKYSYSGIFDGNNFTIRKLSIARESEDNIGLFGSVSGKSLWYPAKIQNVVLDEFKIIGRFYVGALVKYSILKFLTALFLPKVSLVG